MAEHGVGCDEHLVAGGLDAPAQVDVVPHQRQSAVEAAQFARRRPGGRACRRWRRRGRAGPGRAGPGPARGGPGRSSGARCWRWRRRLPGAAAVVPAAQLGADDGGGGAGVGDAQQFGEGLGFGCAVVVEEPQPLDRFAVGQLRHLVGLVAPGAGDGVPAAGAPEVGQVVGGEDGGAAVCLLDGGAEAGASREVEDAVVAEGFGEQARGVVGAAGVGPDDVLHRSGPGRAGRRARRAASARRHD